MSEIYLGLGLAMVDEKINCPGLEVEGTIREFADSREIDMRVAGGVTPNIATALKQFDSSYDVRLLARVGDDERGEFYKQSSSELGLLQTEQEQSTGLVVSLINNQGEVYYRDRDLAAAQNVNVPLNYTQSDPKLFMTDMTTLRLPRPRIGAEKLIDSMATGKIFLNLAGINKDIADVDSQIDIIKGLSKLPDIVTGNEEEFDLLESRIGKQAAAELFPRDSLVVKTLGKRGSVMRFLGGEITIPAYAKARMVDETGAGDAYAGIMLGGLYRRPFERWDPCYITRVGNVAAFGASLVVSSSQTRLTQEQMALVKSQYELVMQKP